MIQDKNLPPHPQQAPQGTVLEVEHIPSKNGEEIHTRIVLKGHSLPVFWRSVQFHHTTSPELIHNPEHCIYCQQCSQICPKGCLHLTDEGLEIKRQHCNTCGDCVKECPSSSLQSAGLRTTAGDLLHKTLKQNYATARKVTQIAVSGGEPGLQTAFCADLLFQLSSAGIPAILETSGMVAYDHLLPLLSHPGQINFELITTNERLHVRLTGEGNKLILENLEKISSEILPPTKLVVRTPLIHNETGTEAEICQTGRWLAEHLLPNCHKWELLEPLSVSEKTPPFSAQEWQQFHGWAAASGFPAEQISLAERNSLRY